MSSSKSRTRSFGSNHALSRSPLRQALGSTAANAATTSQYAGQGTALGAGSSSAAGNLEHGDRRRSSSRHPRSSSASVSSHARPLLTSRPIFLWTHEPPNFSKDELVINPDLIAAFGGVSDGSELLEISLLDTPAFFDPQAPSSQGARLAHATGLQQNAPKSGQNRTATAEEAHKRRRDRGIARRTFVFRASQGVGDMECIERSSPQLQLSISRTIANVFGLHNRSEVVLSKVSLADHTISHIELYFRDQYLGRADQWRLISLLEDTCVYVGQRVTLSGCVRATIGRIFINEKKVMSGYVGPQTRAIFRSESAKYNLFIQMAKEMWEFDEDGEIYYEKALSGFLPDLIKRWQSANTTHVISICLFARVFYDESELHMLQEAALPLLREHDKKERWYIDYYKVIVDLESDCDWTQAITMLKEEFFRFRHDVLLLRRPVSGPAGAPWLEEKHADLLRRDRAVLAGTLASSHEGNVLEAINLALNPFDEHYIDRDLNRTGLDLLILSAGTGHFDVDKRLLRLTTERLIDSGIGFDLVCLTKMPLHSVPLFHFQSSLPATDDNKGTQRSQKHRTRMSLSVRSGPSATQPSLPDPLYTDEKDQLGKGYTRKSLGPPSTLTDFYSIPHWVDCSFYNLQQDKPFRAGRFVPRCKMHEIQMLGLMENEISDIAIPYLDFSRIPGVRVTASSVGRSVSMSNSLVPGLSTSGSGRFSRQTFQLSDSFGDANGLSKRERHRILREQYDQETFRDLEDVPTVYRPWLAHANSDVATLPLLSTSPSNARQMPFGSGLRTPTSEKRRRSGDFDLQKIASPSASVKGNRPNRMTRDSLVSSPSLASHMEQPDHSDEGARPASRAPESAPPIKGVDSNPVSPTTPQSPTPGSSSRPSSIYSSSGLSRGIRPLEPMGKAKALVAPSEVEFEGEQDQKGNFPKDGEVVDNNVEHTTSKAVELMRKASTTGTAQSTPKSKSGYSWLWSSLKRSTGLQPQSPTRESPSFDTKGRNDMSPIRGPPRVRLGHGESAIDVPTRNSSEQSKESIGDGGRSPEPILIPSHASEGTNGENDESISANAKSNDELRQTLEDEYARARYAAQAQVEKQTLVNPCNPKKSLEVVPNSQLMRWQHAFPRRLNQHVVKWRSMTTPACLPLTTVYLPSEADLKNQWQEYPYQMSVASDTSSFMVKRASSTPPALAVLREMAAQRLAQGFQFIVPASASNPRRPFAPVTSDTEPQKIRLQEPWELFQPGSLASGNPIYLSMTNQIHRILFDRESNCIHVKRFVRRTDYDTTPVGYSCCVWARNLPGYQTVSAQFQYPDTAGYNWTYLDGLIAGYNEEEELGDTTRYWRTRFVVVPTEGSPPALKGPSGELFSDEEIRLAGMDRLAELFSRAKWRRRNNSSSGRVQQRTAVSAAAPLRFVPTSLDPAISLRDKDFMRQVEAAHEEDSRDVAANRRHQKKDSSGIISRTFHHLDQHAIVKHMYDKTYGLKINDRLWNRVMYRETFSGADFVTWLCAEFADVGSRNDATACGQRLLKEGILQHVYDYHGFIDGHYFYRVRPTLVKTMRDRGNGGEKAASSDHARSSMESKTEAKAPRRGSRHILMSRSMIIDVDQGHRSDRAEVALLHHDLAHNPMNGFNFQIHWLGTTARFIEDLVQSWTRAVERYGLRLIEAPINQIKDVSQHNPFQMPLLINLALHPPASSVFAWYIPEHGSTELYFEYALLRRFGFILDQEASAKYGHISKEFSIEYKSRPNHFDFSQFVHRSGVAFVQVLPKSEGFLWLDNRLYTSHHSQHAQQQQPVNPHSVRATQSHGRQSPDTSHSGQGHHVSADMIRREFVEFCGDMERLESFYRSELELLAKSAAHNHGPLVPSVPGDI